MASVSSVFVFAKAASIYRGERVKLGCTDFIPLRICLPVYIDPIEVEQSPLYAIVVRGTAAKTDSDIVVGEVLQNVYIYIGGDNLVLCSSFAP